MAENLIFEKEIGERDRLFIDAYLEGKRGSAKKVCRLIIAHLINESTDENRGWIQSNRVFKKCSQKGMLPETISRQLKALQRANIIDREEFLSAPTRNRNGDEKNKPNVFYRFSKSGKYKWEWTPDEWYTNYKALWNDYLEALDQLKMVQILIGQLDLRHPDIMRDLLRKYYPKLVEEYNNKPEFLPNDLVIYLWTKKNELRDSERRVKNPEPVLTTEDILKLIVSKQ